MFEGKNDAKRQGLRANGEEGRAKGQETSVKCPERFGSCSSAVASAVFVLSIYGEFGSDVSS